MGLLDSCKAVFFDAGGTLFQPFPSVGEIYRRVASRYGSPAAAGQIEARFHELWHERDRRGDSLDQTDGKREKEWWKGLVGEVFSGLGGVKDFEIFFEELYAHFGGPDCWRLYPETLVVVESLRAAGKRLCIVSNWDERLFRIAEGLGIESRFEFILASAVFGAAKPSPRIFREALRRAGVSAEEAVHVGDSFEDDILGARGAGLRCVWLLRSGSPGEERLEGVPVICNLKELISC